MGSMNPEHVLDLCIEKPKFWLQIWLPWNNSFEDADSGEEMQNTFSLVQSLCAYFLLGFTTVFATINTAAAQESPSGFEVQELRIGVGLSAERWAEDAIATIYGKNGKMFPTLSMSYRFHKNFSIDASAGTGRLTTENTRNELQLLPVTVGGSILFGNSDREPFVSVGAGFVQFSEKLLPYYTSEFPTMTYGTKLGVDAKAGVRIATSIVSSSTQHPRQPKGASQMDIEIAMGYRTHQAFGLGTGLNLNAFRTSIGFNLRY